MAVDQAIKPLAHHQDTCIPPGVQQSVILRIRAVHTRAGLQNKDRLRLPTGFGVGGMISGSITFSLYYAASWHFLDRNDYRRLIYQISRRFWRQGPFWIGCLNYVGQSVRKYQGLSKCGRHKTPGQTQNNNGTDFHRMGTRIWFSLWTRVAAWLKLEKQVVHSDNSLLDKACHPISFALPSLGGMGILKTAMQHIVSFHHMDLLDPATGWCSYVRLRE